MRHTPPLEEGVLPRAAATWAAATRPSARGLLVPHNFDRAVNRSKTREAGPQQTTERGPSGPNVNITPCLLLVRWSFCRRGSATPRRRACVRLCIPPPACMIDARGAQIVASIDL